ncbi:MAG: hypothetical protein L3J30_03545 [Marinosulfonomonas sp.]|nr:hypothetical protein [Marinosulfonomonas sp.]
MNDPKGDEDGVRNDGTVLTAANKNAWYVLATIFGEQEENARVWDYDEDLAAKNRRAWNLRPATRIWATGRLYVARLPLKASMSR